MNEILGAASDAGFSFTEDQEEKLALLWHSRWARRRIEKKIRRSGGLGAVDWDAFLDFLEKLLQLLAPFFSIKL